MDSPLYTPELFGVNLFDIQGEKVNRNRNVVWEHGLASIYVTFSFFLHSILKVKDELDINALDFWSSQKSIRPTQLMGIEHQEIWTLLNQFSILLQNTFKNRNKLRV